MSRSHRLCEGFKGVSGIATLKQHRGVILLAAVGAIAIGGTAFVAGSTLIGGSREGAEPVPARFADETAAAGLAHTYDGDFEFFVGGGVAVFDCDDDGRADLFFAGGINAAALYRNVSAVGRELRFEQIEHSATDLAQVTGAYPIDVDSDGRLDLVVLRQGEDVVLRGMGDCRFERANEELSIDGGEAWTTAFSATWEGSAALPTLAFGNYVDPERHLVETEVCEDNILLRPNHAGSGYGPPIPLAPGYCALSMLFTDWNRTGERDLRVSNDRHYYREGEEQLWRIVRGEPPRLYTADDGWRSMQIWGMGIASQDLTGDGRPEVFLTSQGDNRLQTLADGSGRPTYTDIAFERGVTAHRPYAGDEQLPSTAWHPQFDDVNNDGRMDLFISKGNVDSEPDFAANDPNNLLLGRADGTFAESAEAAGIVRFTRARGAALADFNQDGLLDLVVVNRREPVTLWRNVGSGSAEDPASMGHWLGIRLKQAAPNVDGTGAWIELRAGGQTLTREVTVGGGHAGGQLGPTHFGLGAADAAEVRVTWPDGETGPWIPVTADQYVTVDRETGEVTPWRLP